MKTPHTPRARWLRLLASRASLVSALGLSAFVLLACSGVPEVTVDSDGADGDDDGGTGGSGTGGTILNVGGDDGGTDPDPDPDSKSVCGNGELEPGELCDDGNKKNGDGCSANCKEQDPEYDCSKPGEPCVDMVVCGNERLEGDEECDDGNDVANDGCTASCTVTAGWVCPRPGEPCVELPVCGNGERERGEQCDDGDTFSGDGCSGTETEGVAGCQLEDGFYCPVPGNGCIELICGDGTRTPDEECDDGDDPPVSGDGCSNVCELEVGWRCNSNGCSPICGDGRILGTEECDDGGRVGGDGCSAGCKEEPFYDCTGAPSDCVSSIQCGNGTIEPGEICDPPGTAGCLTGCKSFAPDTGPAAVCGNSVIEPGETCDAPNVGSGCSAGCLVENGWTCPAPNQCFRLPTCGDGIVQGTEECDVGSMSSPGCVGCDVQDGWLCTGVQPSVCEQPVCGDGNRTPDEECDDDNTTPDDGCTSCVVDEGWVCPTVGEECIPRCGDGVLTGDEECDDGDRTNGDGCNAACRVEPGFACPDAGEECVEAVCGNTVKEPGEGCDDGNKIAGDGCGPTCQLEPTVTVGPSPVVQVKCGDGVKTGSEQCDDGNETAGDGCSATCQEETGFECTERLDLPSSVQFRVRVRDFKSSVATGGHPDFQYGFMDHVPSIPGTVCNWADRATCGRLDANGKPELKVFNQGTTGITSAQTFGLWYRDSNPTNVAGLHGTISMLAPFNKTLTLAQIGGPTSEVYQFDAQGSFFPLGDAEGFGPIKTDAGTCCSNNGACNDGVRCTGDCAWRDVANQQCDGDCSGPDCQDRNFGFTTELRYFFQYKGGETLSFRGDDDVWVFINGRLAVDIGGLHQVRYGRVVLGDDGAPSGTESDCSAQAATSEPGPCALTPAEAGDATDRRFGLTKDNVYEIVLFHAERHTSASNFQLTLSGFIAPRSFCSPDCGDGEVVGYEVCDDGDDNSNSTYGACNTTCTGRTFCGDGIRQGASDNPSGPETCDNGRNLDTRSTGAPNQCAPGCQAPTRCGDGVVQAAFEQCDRGGLNDDNGYGPTSCTTSCAIGGYCGDGTRNGPETCDYAAPGSTTYGPSSCGYNCQAGPRCGDGVRNGPEECDGTMNCNSDCTLAPFCGDGVVSAGESCDYAQFASNDYGGCTSACQWGPLCGDEDVDSPYEECDEGIAGNDGSYDGCTSSCAFGPRCGDGVLQANQGEACDNGYNDDTYTYDDESCGAGCSLPPSCGDGVVQSGFELCDEGDDNDDGAYLGCSTSCEWGPYCGDGVKNGPEKCDHGGDNVAYAAAAGACSYDCKDAPYCGDGVRNGPEQCDDKKNTGEYGGCKPDCKLAPYCGDGVVQANQGEQCDDGPTGSLACSVACKKRGVVR